MTTEEKRKAIQEECETHDDCDTCPHTDGFCCKHSSSNADPEIIDKWYESVFPTTTIKDSGERREFDTGAVRDIQEGKGRCDLMPLDAISGIMDDSILYCLSRFQEKGDLCQLSVALLHFCDANYHHLTSTMFLEVAKHFEEGAKKYGEYNWQKGIPVHCYIDSAVRHYLKWLRGDNDEPHDRAFVWNIICCIWTCIHKPELNDYVRGDENVT